MALTDVKCRSAKAGPARLKLSDGGGLQLWVQTNGARLWQFAYRFGGKQKQLSFGPYPEVSLLEARGKRDDARRKLRDGIDPAAEKKLRQEAAATPGDTFKEVAVEFIEKCRRENLAGVTLLKKEWLLDFAYGQDEMTSHGFRASASTLLNESGKWSADAIERQLAHVESNSVRRAYARGVHWDERVKMMAWWADYLDRLRGNSGNKSLKIAS